MTRGGEEKPVCIGDKFRAGEHGLNLKFYGKWDKIEAGVYQCDKSKRSWGGELEIILVDSKGNEYTTEASMEVEDNSFEMEMLGVRWAAPIELDGDWFPVKLPKDVGECIFNFACKIHNVPGRFDQYKILSLQADDGTPVSIVGKWGRDLLGEEWTASCFKDGVYFRFNEIKYLTKPLKLTLTLEGEGGVVRSADLELNASHNEEILRRHIDWMLMKGLGINSWLREALREAGWREMNFKQYDRHRAEECGEATVFYLEQVKEIGLQVKNSKLFSSISADTANDLQEALEKAREGSDNLKKLNKKFGFNFPIPF